MLAAYSGNRQTSRQIRTGPTSPAQNEGVSIRISVVKKRLNMTKKTAYTQITRTQIYRAVASSTAIETGVSVQKIEQQL